MTIILIAMNKDYALQASDRRISHAGRAIEEEYGKSFSLALPGFRFSVAFTGLATLGSFRTADWLLDTLVSLGKLTAEPVALIDRLARALTRRFTTFLDIKGLPVGERRLAVTIVGYNYTAMPPRGLAAEITNWSDPNAPFQTLFSSERRPLDEAWTWMGAFGNGAALDRDKIEAVRQKLAQGVGPAIIQGMLEKQIRAMADDARSGNTIGKQIDHIVLHSDPTMPTIGGRSSAVVRPEFTMPAAVMIGDEGQVAAFKGISVAPADIDTLPLTVPRVHRNRPCPCGSGAKYRHCHGRKLP